MSNKLNKYTNLLYEIKPELFNEWNFEKNNKLDFHKITNGMSIKVWWKCPLCKSDYECSINNKFRGKSCSYCSGRKVNETNNLQKTNPEIAKSWDYGKNKINPNQITKGSNVKFWWICEICDSSYECSVANRTYGFKCSFCSGQKVNHTNSLLSLNPELAKEWHPNKNGDLTPDKVTHKSNKKVWWLGKCGHEWNQIIYDRVNKSKKCPYCANQKILIGFNDMWTTNPKLASMLANPEDGYRYMQSSGKKVNWRCLDCNDLFCRRVDSMLNNSINLCSICRRGLSIGEIIISQLLEIKEIYFNKEKKFSWSDNKRYDFYLPNYNAIIEVHGVQHYKNSFESMGGRSLNEEQENDRYKEQLAKENGIKYYIVIDCRNSDIEWIKNSILNSRLTEVLNLKNFEWKKLNIAESYQKYIAKTNNLWNKGMKDVNHISELLKISRNSVTRYLKIGALTGLSDYSVTNSRKIAIRKYQKEIAQLKNNNTFIKSYTSIKQAVRELGKSSNSNICQACKGNQRTAYGFKWMYKEDYENMIKENNIIEENLL